MHIDTLGDYTIQKKIGEGSFGSIYLAQHRFLKRPFLLKVLPESLSKESGFIRRFEEGVAQIAALTHPNLLPIHTVTYSEGRYFLVVDPLDPSFESLDQKVGPMTEEEIETILRQIASALDAVHAAGFVHGGLKLTNILLGKGHVLLADVGLSSWIGPSLFLQKVCEEVAREFSPRFIHSYAFLAPEQKTQKEADLKSDVYAFGVLSYYLLTGKIPEGCFEWPSRLSPGRQKNWDPLVAKCLQANPSLRPDSLLPLFDEIAPKSETPKETTAQEDHTLQMSFPFPKEPLLKPVLKPQEISRPEYEEDPGAIFQRESYVSHYTPEKKEVHEISPLLTEMVVIPAGTYFRGSAEGARDEMPRHEVKISSFALDIHPVTNEQFVRFLEVMGGEKDHNNNDIVRLKESRIKRNAGKLIIEFGYAKHPVVGVTWYGALAYAKWIGKRLPTEAEWEIAATGGQENSIYPTGAEIERPQANFFGSDTTPVLSYPPNSLKLYDMAGNVYEWCQDWYAYNYYDHSAADPAYPKGPAQGVYRVVRGGCWKSLKEDLRCSHRHRNNPGAANATYGFRCAADVS